MSLSLNTRPTSSGGQPAVADRTHAQLAACHMAMELPGWPTRLFFLCAGARCPYLPDCIMHFVHRPLGRGTLLRDTCLGVHSLGTYLDTYLVARNGSSLACGVSLVVGSPGSAVTPSPCGRIYRFQIGTQIARQTMDGPINKRNKPLRWDRPWPLLLPSPDPRKWAPGRVVDLSTAVRQCGQCGLAG